MQRKSVFNVKYLDEYPSSSSPTIRGVDGKVVAQWMFQGEFLYECYVFIDRTVLKFPQVFSL